MKIKETWMVKYVKHKNIFKRLFCQPKTKWVHVCLKDKTLYIDGKKIGKFKYHKDISHFLFNYGIDGSWIYQFEFLDHKPLKAIDI